MKTNLVEIAAKNSPYQGRKISVYDSYIIENLIRGYALALASHSLRKNQRHIGDRCVFLLSALVRTALDAAIKEACGLIPDIQKTAQRHYIDAIGLIQELGFTCSIDSGDNPIATKKDIINFLEIPQSTLNNFLRKHRDEITPIQLTVSTIHSIGCKAKRMNGYSMDDVAKIACGMNTKVGIEIKEKLFGQIGAFATPYTKEEVQWQKTFSTVFKNLGLYYNYSIGRKYKVDYFVSALSLVLECNGYSHRYYDPKEEKEREEVITQKYGLIRFHHKVTWEKLVNAILQIKPGKIIRLYDLKNICKNN